MRTIAMGARECCLCRMRQDVFVLATFDTPINGGSWGYVCDGHMAAVGSMALASRIVVSG